MDVLVIALLIIAIVLFCWFVSSRTRPTSKGYSVTSPRKTTKTKHGYRTDEQTEVKNDSLSVGVPPKQDHQRPTAQQKRSPKRSSVSRTTSHTYDWENSHQRVRYNYEERFEQSILSPFPDDGSPAMEKLYEIDEKIKEGADPATIDRILEEAENIDPDAVKYYLARRSIIDKKQNE